MKYSLFAVLITSLFYFQAPCYGEHRYDAPNTDENGDPSELAKRLTARATSAVNSLLKGTPTAPSIMQNRCFKCHNRQGFKEIDYTLKVNGKEIEVDSVKIDFTELNNELTRFLNNLTTRIPASESGQRIQLDKKQSYWLMTLFHRMQENLGVGEHKHAKALRDFVTRYTNITDEVLDLFLKYKAPFPDIELRRRVVQIFGPIFKRTPPPNPLPEEFFKEEPSAGFIKLSLAVGVPETEMKTWIRQVNVTSIVADRDR